MKTDELREAYLSFFESKGCVRRPSDVLVPHDPSVLFTPAGMNQFKNEFLGIGQLQFTRATTCQKCLRTGDISNVGVTAYHHTFFEMLGNFSFGDYFKKEAIHWAWEFLTGEKWLKLDPERLTVTVYLDDDEAFNIWEQEIGLPKARIRRDDEYENFWPAGAPTDGPDGVCGPCSEIYYHPPSGGKEVEIWNLVFTQFNRVGSPPDNLKPLPKKNIDTGMGLERTASVLQGKESNFEIDSLRPLCETAGDILDIKYSFDGDHGRAIRRIADHVRAVTMCVHENQLPGNNKQGYVVRQLLRRASLEGFLAGKQDPFLFQLVPKVVELLSKPYPDLKQSIGSAQEAIKEEEEQFLDTIERGLRRFDGALKEANSTGIISGKDAFTLHTTDGFLIEMTEAMAARHNLKLDRAEYDRLMKEHEIVSGSGATVDAVMAEGPLDAVRKSSGPTDFVGYDMVSCEAEVVGIIAEKQLIEEVTEIGTEDVIGVLLDRTPFYGESGGQVGDTGLLSTDDVEFAVQDTQKDNDLWLHIGHLRRGTLKVGQKLTAAVDENRRDGIRRAHSATHLMHHALRTTLGENATQRGSKVQQDELRFDFAHRQPLTPNEIETIENIVNNHISAGSPVEIELMELPKAREKGAMALFGEKYPDIVRVVSMGDYSVELCGGTHLNNTGQAGLFKIINEELVAKGVRRITAYTGERALQELRDKEAILKDLMISLKANRPEELLTRIENLKQELKAAQEEVAAFAKQNIAASVGDILNQGETVGDVIVVAKRVEGVNRDGLREFADQLRSQKKDVALILAAEIDGNVSLIAAVSKPLTKQGLHAGNCVREAAKLVGGGGGGRPDLAEAGGKNADGIDAALEKGAEVFREQLAAKKA